MSSNSQIDLTSIGLKKNYLYEILATTFSMDNNLIVPNTASMGVRLVEKKNMKIWPYPSTKTYKNVEDSRFVVVNLIDDVYLYAVASLKGSNFSKLDEALSEKQYNYYNLNVNDAYKDFARRITTAESIKLPYLKQSWAIIVCLATNINHILREDDFGKFKLMEIDLTVICYQKFRESFKLYNRAENLALETIVLATKLNVAILKKEEAFIRKIKTKIDENFSAIKRFGKNLSALKVIEHIQEYIKGLET
ncbi:MAG: DUF447 domain-containing protein [Candidatus Thorarchaeota archaeon]